MEARYLHIYIRILSSIISKYIRAAKECFSFMTSHFELRIKYLMSVEVNVCIDKVGKDGLIYVKANYSAYIKVLSLMVSTVVAKVVLCTSILVVNCLRVEVYLAGWITPS